MSRPITVEVLHTPTWGDWRAARAAAVRVAGEEGLAVDIVHEVVASLADARRLRLPGSPTVRVEGRDLQPQVEDLDAYGLGWRTYRGPGGAEGSALVELLRGALRRAADDRRALERQRDHWTQTFAERADRYGGEPSEAARMAASLFRAAGYGHLLELGAGQGRDACFFAASGLRVYALDYAPSAVAAVRAKALAAGLGALVTPRQHDVRERLPFADESLDACYAHMLFCMALTTGEIEALTLEVHRVLRPGGLVVYTARNTADPDYRRGAARGEDMYEVGGFIVHFFGRELVDRLAAGYDLVDVTEFEEGSLPRRLFRVTMRKAPIGGTAEG